MSGYEGLFLLSLNFKGIYHLKKKNQKKLHTPVKEHEGKRDIQQEYLDKRIHITGFVKGCAYIM